MKIAISESPLPPGEGYNCTAAGGTTPWKGEVGRRLESKPRTTPGAVVEGWGEGIKLPDIALFVAFDPLILTFSLGEKGLESAENQFN